MNIEGLNLQKFTGYGAKVSRKISITRSYSFGFPPAFYKENRLDRYTHVVLYFDPNSRVIGFRFISDATDEGFKLAVYGEGDRSGASIVARSFFNEYNIDVQKIHGRYDATKITKDGIGELFLIELREETTGEAFGNLDG